MYAPRGIILSAFIKGKVCMLGFVCIFVCTLYAIICMYICTYIQMYVPRGIILSAFIKGKVCMYICTYIQMYVWLCMYICKYIQMYVWLCTRGCERVITSDSFFLSNFYALDFSGSSEQKARMLSTHHQYFGRTIF